MRQIYNSAGIGTLGVADDGRRRGWKSGEKNPGRLIVPRQVARECRFLVAFSRRNRVRPLYIVIPSPRLHPSVRPRSDHPLTFARSPALVLSPGIYNTLCFPSAICLEFSTPSSLTLLSRVLFLFNPASVELRVLPPPSPRTSCRLSVPPRRLRFLSVGESLNERTPRRIWPGFFMPGSSRPDFGFDKNFASRNWVRAHYEDATASWDILNRH